MSAQIQNLDYMPLRRKLEASRSKRVTVAFETTATLEGETIVIRHHGNIVAAIESFRLMVTNAGWSSPTTRQRVNAVMRDNGIPYGVTQKSFVQVLVTHPADWREKRDTVERYWIESTFAMIAGSWTLTPEGL